MLIIKLFACGHLNIEKRDLFEVKVQRVTRLTDIALIYCLVRVISNREYRNIGVETQPEICMGGGLNSESKDYNSY